ncbi:hypothetical protein [Anaerospora hongkongensis]|uniref:hypothetical protein n=1 Tax=Anaerospora hongkongensis TaxID=244830 RepID=UPI00289839C0|nr:hypothetical protein [Anaerospora hongkongensis]
MGENAIELSVQKSFIHNIKVQLYKLAVARSDIASANSLCKLFIEKRLMHREEANDHYELRDALISAILVSYSRPFTNNHPHGPLQKKWFKFDNKSFNELHRRIIDYRNKQIAHSDFDIRKVYLCPRGYQDEFLVGGLVISNKPFPIEDIETIRDMCDELRVRFGIEIRTLSKHLLNYFPTSTALIDIFSETPYKREE